MQNFKIVGQTETERFEYIERALNYIRRRLGNKVVGMIPPVPILHSCRVPEEDGTIFECVIPCSGIIPIVYFRVGKYLGEGETLVSVAVNSHGVNLEVSVVCDNPIEKTEPNWKVRGGDFLTVRVSPPDSVERVSIGMLFQPEMSQAMRELYVLDAILALEASSDEVPDE